MTWKLQTLQVNLQGQEISVERDMLVGRHQDAEIYCSPLIFHENMLHYCLEMTIFG